jgi:hypothetical protein
MKVICACHQYEASAALWHDGQITMAKEKRVKDFIIPAREAIASSDSPHEHTRHTGQSASTILLRCLDGDLASVTTVAFRPVTRYSVTRYSGGVQ